MHDNSVGRDDKIVLNSDKVQITDCNGLLTSGFFSRSLIAFLGAPSASCKNVWNASWHNLLSLPTKLLSTCTLEWQNHQEVKSNSLLFLLSSVFRSTFNSRLFQHFDYLFVFSRDGTGRPKRTATRKFFDSIQTARTRISRCRRT